MVPLYFQLIAAVALDLLIGDPRRFPHPVRIIGGYASLNEIFWRGQVQNPLTAGFAAWLTVILTTAVGAAVFLEVTGMVHPIARDIASIILIYFCIAAKDLSVHGKRVREALENNDLPSARERVGFLVSRDTTRMEEDELVRATVESLSENSSDGIIAPLFFAVIGGPVLVMVYKAVSTLDSMFGYTTDRYIRFGYVSAKADDLFNYLPARITAFCVAVTAFVVGGTYSNALRIVSRDGQNNPSPNAGVAEAAFAGALGVELGGESTYFGEIVEKPRIGDRGRPPKREHIGQAIKLSIAAAALFLFVGVMVRLLFAVVD